jgi:hypothetical protein
VGSTLGIFAFVVLNNHALLALFDVLPICFEVDIKEVIASKHKLCRRGVVGGVDSCAHAECNCCQDTDPAVGQVMLAAKLLGANHVMNCLMRPFHHSISLGISRSDRPSYNAIVSEEVNDHVNSMGLGHQGKDIVIRQRKNLARLAREQSSCDLRTDLESDVRVYIRMSSIREWTHTSHA